MTPASISRTTRVRASRKANQVWHKRPKPSPETGPSFPYTGLVDRDPGICPAGRGAHATGEQGGHLGLSSPPWPQRVCHGLVLTKFLCPGQVDSTQERVVKREDGEKLAKVSQIGEGEEGVLEMVTFGLSPCAQHPAGSSYLQEYGLPFMETSAKTGLNVDLAFTAIAK